MNRIEDSPPRVIETNIDFPALSVNGDLNKGSNGNNRTAPIPEESDDHEMETPPQATDIMLSGDTKIPLHPLHHHHHHHHPMHHHHHPLHHHHRHRSNNEEEEEDEEDGVAMKKRKPSQLDKMADRHGLTKKGVVLLMLACVVCVLLVVALLVMVVLWPRDLLEEKLEICLTPDCLRASAQIPDAFGRLGSKIKEKLERSEALAVGMVTPVTVTCPNIPKIKEGKGDCFGRSYHSAPLGVGSSPSPLDISMDVR
ncbi:uncharacterized protein LOC143019816 [Oratosquilla oratoria]|uniref:uncharacterized protein LOC143019816 n=1 Tax=Oratosquilla oratoria TaxID=337810 RepID=UPI003F758152